MKRILKKIYHRLFFSSSKYWQQRYASGGNSGAGSYHAIAEFKAQIINNFVAEHSIERLIDFGCGDGNQLGMLKIKEYIGIDVSQAAIDICKNKYKNQADKTFLLYTPEVMSKLKKLSPPTQLTISLDVIFHLVENKVLFAYLNDLFSVSNKYVIIFSTNFDQSYDTPHQIDRKTETIVKKHFPEWELIQYIENPHKGSLTMADFFIYRKIITK